MGVSFATRHGENKKFAVNWGYLGGSNSDGVLVKNWVELSGQVRSHGRLRVINKLIIIILYPLATLYYSWYYIAE